MQPLPNGKVMADFTDILAGTVPESEYANIATATLAHYPWFMTARIMESILTGRTDELAALHLMFHPYPSLMLKAVDRSEFASGNGKEPSAAELIEQFLMDGEHRIVPDDEITEYDAGEESARLELSQEFVSEELAAIYEQQGLHDKAAEIYRLLGK